jgi:hypothetical protein
LRATTAPAAIIAPSARQTSLALLQDPGLLPGHESKTLFLPGSLPAFPDGLPDDFPKDRTSQGMRRTLAGPRRGTDRLLKFTYRNVAPDEPPDTFPDEPQDVVGLARFTIRFLSDGDA